MTTLYILAPVVGYLVAGSLKFAINTFKLRQLAFTGIGMGGIPSTHNTIASTTFFTIGFGEGFTAPVAAVSLMVGIVVAIDSMDLRRKIEHHAILIALELGKVNEDARSLRTRLGHKPIEVAVGWSLGALLGFATMLIDTSM